MTHRGHRLCSVLSFLLSSAFSSLLLFDPAPAIATERIPGEEQIGILHTITHLNPVAYVILFLVFLLSVVTLLYQGRFSGLASFLATWRRSTRGPDGKDQGDHPTADPSLVVGDRYRARLGPRPKADVMTNEGDAGDSVVGKPRMVARARGAGVGRPTPLDGVNHRLPSFSPTEGGRSSEPEAVDTGQKRSTPPPHQFRFTSAVDLLSPEEMEKREKEKLVVSGTVTGPDGKGIPSAIVYLTDEDGKRLGQSYLSGPETGEFKVQTNQPGRYVLYAHKRGYIMEQANPEVLPVESGKIEGYSLRMMPEGCTVHGKVTFEKNIERPQAMAVRCVVEGTSFTGFGRVGLSGSFIIHGVPLESRCHLEVRTTKGDVLAVSDPFETRHERYVTANVTV